MTSVTASVAIMQDGKEFRNLAIDTENIPYHARENALPFTYGNVPFGFNACDLNHVNGSDHIKSFEAVGTITEKVGFHSMIRKSTRPSISTSCPLLRKDSREEFEDLLLTRKEDALDKTGDLAYKLIEYDSIQNSLDEIQKRLISTLHKNQDISIKSVNFPNVEHCSIIKPEQLEIKLIENHRSNTPTFRCIEKPLNTDRCVSPYLAKALTTINLKKELEMQNIESYFPNSYGTDYTKDVEPRLVQFPKDTSELWYKPNITRSEAVDILRYTKPGAFLIRNSTTYQNSFGLVLRVAKPPYAILTATEYGDQFVRHFLLVPTKLGIHLLGCTNEPIFTSLSAFVYEHSINKMALPCTLIIPNKEFFDVSNNEKLSLSHKQIVTQDVAYNVLYLYQADMESLTGDDAVRKAVTELFLCPTRPESFEVHFKVSEKGITLTDNTRTKFLRKHYPTKNISYFCLDPDTHFWNVLASDEGLQRTVKKSIFAFIARPLSGSKDNQCHIFCDLSSLQPASVIVSFAHKVLQIKNSCSK